MSVRVDPVSRVEKRVLVPVHRYSTGHLPPEARYADWCDRSWPRAAPIYRTTPSEPFDTWWETAQLGLVTFVHTRITGMRWERRLSDIRQSDFDPIIVNMMVEGEARGDMDGCAFHEGPGDFHFHDLGRPSLHDSTASLTYSLIIPRPTAQEWLSPLEDLHGMVVSGRPAGLLISQAAQVAPLLGHLDLEQAERLGRVFLETLVVILSGARGAESARRSPGEVLRLRALELIEQTMVEGDVSVAQLCRSLDVSRARLFAAFRADGGVQAFVLTERLRRARAALDDLARNEPVGVIAHRLGFSDAAHLSRAFRRRFGVTPTAYRRLAARTDGSGR